jgi:hypothetical protein
MFSGITKTAAAAAFGLALLGAASASNATIYNISATSSAGVDVTLAAGTYQVSWVGVAGGGLYNAWNGNCVSGDCTSGWVENFSSVGLPFDPNDFTLDIFGVGPPQASALGALQAIQSAASINNGSIDFLGGVAGVFQPSAPIPQPWIVNTGGGSIRLRAGDGTPDNNFGGVSLSIVAVPEPATWAMLLTGFAFAGAALRRRRTRAFA